MAEILDHIVDFAAKIEEDDRVSLGKLKINDMLISFVDNTKYL